MLDRLNEKVKLAPRMAIKLKAGVPRKSPMISISKLSKGIVKSADITGQIKIIGKLIDIQCANAFRAKTNSKGMGEISSKSKLPSLKSS